MQGIPPRYKDRIIRAESDAQFEALRVEVGSDPDCTPEDSAGLLDLIENTRLTLRISELEDEQGKAALKNEVEANGHLTAVSRRGLLATLELWEPW